MIYVLWAENTPYFKIGFTNGDDAKKRCGECQIGSPHKLEVIATADGGEAAEKELHQTLSDLRVRGEWFDICGFINMPLKTQIAVWTKLETGLDARLALKALLVGVIHSASKLIDSKNMAKMLPLLRLLGLWSYLFGAAKGRANLQAKYDRSIAEHSALIAEYEGLVAAYEALLSSVSYSQPPSAE